MKTFKECVVVAMVAIGVFLISFGIYLALYFVLRRVWP